MVLTMMRLYQNMLVSITIIVMNGILIDLVGGRPPIYGFNYSLTEMHWAGNVQLSKLSRMLEANTYPSLNKLN